jgi:hypothetical protein
VLPGRTGREREGDDELAPAPWAIAAGFHASFVERHDFTHHAQTDAQSSGLGGPHLRVQIKNMGQGVGFDAPSRVADTHGHRRRSPIRRERDAATRIGVLHGVAEQVREHLMKPLRIGVRP